MITVDTHTSIHVVPTYLKKGGCKSCCKFSLLRLADRDNFNYLVLGYSRVPDVLLQVGNAWLMRVVVWKPCLEDLMSITRMC